MAQHELQFANFVCKFGTAPMRTYLNDIVLPAFTDDSKVRPFGEETYFHFHEVKRGFLDPQRRLRPIIYGRYIKNTRISRDQYFERGRGLIRDRRVLRSSPSVFFVLIVENHRLLYYSETPGAPELGSFAATARKFISEKHHDFIDKVYADAKEDESTKTTKKALYEAVPRPKIELIPLSDPTDIDAFLDRYEKLRRVEFKIIDTNDEMDAGQLFQNIRDSFADLHSTQTKLVSSNPKGLDVDGAKEITREATRSGYQEVKFNGEDTEGNRLVGDNESFALRTALEDLPENDLERAQALAEKFDELRANGSITVEPEVPLDDNNRELFDE